MITDLLYVWSTNPATSLVVWTVVSMVILYLGRKQAHQMLYSSGRGLYRCARMWSFSISMLEKQVLKRNEGILEAKFFASSVITQCFISGFILAIGGLVAYVNLQLISVPMQGIVDTSGLDVSASTAELTALVFVLIELVIGLLLTEALGMTHLFPKVGALDGVVRRSLVATTLLLTVALASVEASLFQTRYLMVLGFVIPFALAFIAVPLESFIHSLRVVLGALIISVLRGLVVTLRIMGGLCNSLFMIFRHVYDLIIVIPLGVERLVKSYLGREVQIDVPMLTRVEAESLKSNQLKSRETLAREASLKLMANKATFKTVPASVEPKKPGAKKVIEDSTIAHVNLAETMMSSSL